jgi:hypothetical protein
MTECRSYSRRRFLGGSLAVGAAVAVTGLTPEKSNAAPAVDDASAIPTIPVSQVAPFSHVGVRWHATGDAQLQVRWSTPNGMSAWKNVLENHDLQTPDGMHGGLVVVEETTHVEARVVAGNATNVVVTPISAGGGARFGAADANAALSASAVATPTIITRAQWGANERLRRSDPQFQRITKLIVHHSDTDNGDPNPAATVRAILDFHVNGNGWDDIGYNFLIDEAGRIYEGRWARSYADGEVHNGEDVHGLGVVGAHALNANGGSVGVCLLGNFAGQPPTAAAMDALGRLFAWKATDHDVDPHGASPYLFGDDTFGTFPNISGHRDTYQTSCPGSMAYTQLPALRDRVANLKEAKSKPAATAGYWSAGRDGAVFSYGLAQYYGGMHGQALNAPVVGMSATPSGKGYWLLGADGGIFSFGDAGFHGSTGAMTLNQPVLGIATTPSGQGYWLVASDGGIFAFGDAHFYGSMGGQPLNKPVVGMAATPTGKGYWLVASDGGIFAYGDAPFYGSTGSMKLNEPITAMAATPTGEGYWLIARDGGIFAFGNAAFFGSIPGLRLYNYSGAVAIAPTTSGNGYWIQASDGTVDAFGDAQYVGDQIMPMNSIASLDNLP